jgi:2-(1,2-epoxy-1,2-dihydrophenyl)acetyl-CoA isomerase
MYFTGAKVDASEALTLGIANRVVAHDRFMAEGLDYCKRLAEGPTRAYAAMKTNFRAARSGTLEQALAQEAQTMVASGETRDHREGALSFVEKRPPRFEGR